MKHAGNTSDFIEIRNKELLMAFRKVLKEKPQFDINWDFTFVVNTPCSRFCISEQRAAVVISAILRGQPVLQAMRPTKREMFLEIYSRFIALRIDHPDAPLNDLVFMAVNSPAPKFYMKPRHAREIIYKIKKGVAPVSLTPPPGGPCRQRSATHAV